MSFPSPLLSTIMNKGEWIKIPYSNGQILHVPTGRYMHEDRDFIKKGNVARKPPDVLLRCHDVWRGAGLTKQIVLKFEHTWTKFYELLESEFGEKVVFEYQDRGGQMVTVDDHEKFERFCQAVDDAAILPLTESRRYGTEIDVYIRPYSSEAQEKVKGGMEGQQELYKGQNAKVVDRDEPVNGGNICLQLRCTVS